MGHLGLSWAAAMASSDSSGPRRSVRLARMNDAVSTFDRLLEVGECGTFRYLGGDSHARSSRKTSCQQHRYRGGEITKHRAFEQFPAGDKPSSLGAPTLPRCPGTPER